MSWVLKQDNDFYYSIVVRELKKKAQKVEQLMSNELKLGQEQYQNMLNVVQWLDEHGDLYKRFVTHSLRRIDKNWYVVRARSARISSLLLTSTRTSL